MWNFLLGGKDNYRVDREAAYAFAEVFPNVWTTARECRYFVCRSVRYLAAEAGVRQFLDIGAGLPAPDNVHEVAQRRPMRLRNHGDAVVGPGALDIGACARHAGGDPLDNEGALLDRAREGDGASYAQRSIELRHADASEIGHVKPPRHRARHLAGPLDQDQGRGGIGRKTGARGARAGRGHDQS